MQIARLNTRYQFVGQLDQPAVVAGALDQMLQRIGRRQDTDVHVDGNREAVYIIRRVDSRWLIDSRLLLDDRAEEAWLESSRKAVAEKVRQNDPQDVIRFENQACYVAAFLSALMDGDAWGRWYFFPFKRFRHSSIALIVLQLLQENVEQLDDLLIELNQLGASDAVIDLLDDDSLRLLSRSPTASPHSGARPDVRVHFTTAIDILQQLGWTTSRDPNLMYSQFLLHACAPSDWKNSREHAECVLSAVEFLLEFGTCQPKEFDGDRTALDRLLTSLDWLDCTWLTQQLVFNNHLTNVRSPPNDSVVSADDLTRHNGPSDELSAESDALDNDGAELRSEEGDQGASSS